MHKLNFFLKMILFFLGTQNYYEVPLKKIKDFVW
jgi:hypothetical protein